MTRNNTLFCLKFLIPCRSRAYPEQNRRENGGQIHNLLAVRVCGLKRSFKMYREHAVNVHAKWPKTKVLLGLLCLLGFTSYAQNKMENTEAESALRASQDLTWEANKALRANDFTTAEANYRKAISKSPDHGVAPYNLGNAYYNQGSFGEAFGRYKQAGETAEEKPQKHKAYHNMGNVFMKNKEYQKAVEAYKEALRNTPNDDETRYNLALAKQKAAQQQDNPKNDDGKEDKNPQEQNKEPNKKEDHSQDQGAEKGEENNNQDRKDDSEDHPNGREYLQKKQEQKPGEETPSGTQEQQPRPNQLSKQQIENLLEAMQNEEKKVQEKMDAKKVKGKKIRNEKDW